MEGISKDSLRYHESRRGSPFRQREWNDHDCYHRLSSDPRSSPPSRWRHDHYRRDSEECGPPDSVNLDDSRSLSSHHYPSDSGYHSSGALSDGRGGTDHGGAYHVSSMRSVGSVGSQGSSERERPHVQHRQFSWGGPPVIASHFMNGETRFPTAMSYAASEAAKSDIATVCSGSVVEDIDVASVLSADEKVPQTPTERVVISGTSSSLRRSNSGGVNSQTTPRSVEFAQTTSIPAVACMPPPLGSSAARSSPPLQPTIGIPLNDMGPPLSRSLLLQQQHPTGGAASFGESSRAGSVRSFGSHRSVASSDVVAHVDTDDCGGSLIESGVEDHSDHSEDEKEGPNEAGSGDLTSAPVSADGGACGDGEPAAAPNPLLQRGMTSSHANGRTSPGGTVYKGRGVRRYQGRYMHLPLKRFHQNGVTMMAGNEMMEATAVEHHHTNGHYYHSRYDDRPSSPRWGDGQRAAASRRSRSRSRSPPPRGGGRRKRSWSRSKSGSPTRTRKNGRHRRSRGRGNGWNEQGPSSYRSTRSGGGERNLRSSGSGRAHRSNSRSESPSRGGGYHRYNSSRKEKRQWR